MRSRNNIDIIINDICKLIAGFIFESKKSNSKVMLEIENYIKAEFYDYIKVIDDAFPNANANDKFVQMIQALFIIIQNNLYKDEKRNFIKETMQLSKNASELGFDWNSKDECILKVKEELNELMQANNKNNSKEIEEELGDLMFSIINYARILNIDPENILNKANNKFRTRFEELKKKMLNKTTQNFKGYSPDRVHAVWEQVKVEIKNE